MDKPQIDLDKLREYRKLLSELHALQGEEGADAIGPFASIEKNFPLVKPTPSLTNPYHKRMIDPDDFDEDAAAAYWMNWQYAG